MAKMVIYTVHRRAWPRWLYIQYIDLLGQDGYIYSMAKMVKYTVHRLAWPRWLYIQYIDLYGHWPG